jgi:hypothetical protein
MIPW